MITEQVTFTAEITDSYGVELWQHKKRFEYTVDEARAIAAEISAACDEAQSCIDEDAPAPSELKRVSQATASSPDGQYLPPAHHAY